MRAQVQYIRKQSNQWHIFDNQGALLGAYHWVVLATPVSQAITILGSTLSNYQDLSGCKDLATRKMHSCFSLMLGFINPLLLDFDATLVRNEDLNWISVNSSKPARGDTFSLPIHSTNA